MTRQAGGEAARVFMHEVCARDGLQMEARFVPMMPAKPGLEPVVPGAGALLARRGARP